MPLAVSADAALARLAAASGSMGIGNLDAAGLLCERGMLAGLRVPGYVSAGGGCRLFHAGSDAVALNLARADDRHLLAALFETDERVADDDDAIAACIRQSDPDALLVRGRSMGLAIALESESRHCGASPWRELIRGMPRSDGAQRRPRVLDLSALWAGPLAAHLLWLAGAQVIKVESRSRPDALRIGQPGFFRLLNQGKASVVLDFSDAGDIRALRALILGSDIVIEASRPRALLQLGVDANRMVQTSPGLVWVSITGHGADGAAADSVGFGDDCGVAGGLSAALRKASGRGGFVGDAIADPLTGIAAASAAWYAWQSCGGGRWGLALSEVAAYFLAAERARDEPALNADLVGWRAALGKPFSAKRRELTGSVAAFGADTRACLARTGCG